MLALLIALTACTPPEDTRKPDVAVPPVDTAPEAVDTDTTDTDTTDTSATDTAPTDTAVPYDCSVLPPTPAPFVESYGWPTAEDFDIDGDGFFVAIDATNLVGRDRSGATKIIAPNVSQSTAGTRILPSGDWVVNDVSGGRLILVDAVTGGKSTAASGLSYPNGLEVGRDGYAFIGEQSGGRITQVDPYTGEVWVVADGLSSPNGVILSPDEQTVYSGSFGGGTLYAVDRLGPTDWDAPRVVRDTWPGDITGSFDGINVDICGNIYLTEFGAGYVVRVTPDGTQVDLVADPPSGWIPNMRWGHGIGGWDESTLYVTDIGGGVIYELDMGIPGKKHVLVP